MKCILSDSADPFFNLAAEEYLLKHFSDDFYFQYVNKPTVVVGKHQNALAEIDTGYLEQEGILLARRISGGGAVYHDPGNMNYAFITNESPGDFIQFKKYTAPVIAALHELGIPAHMGKRNELLSGTRKISGTASHVYKSRVLHHGTLLYAADLGHLSKCLYVDEGRYHDKAVKSVRSEVVNLQELMDEPLPGTAFFRFIYDHILHDGADHEAHAFTPADLDAIDALAREKFSTWEWIYGYSPAFELERSVPLGGAILHSRVRVHRGVIDEVAFSRLDIFDTSKVAAVLKGARHNRQEVLNILSGLELDADIRGAVISALF
jgi:lipoate-protein ligase A